MIIQFFVPCYNKGQARRHAKTLNSPSVLGHGFKESPKHPMVTNSGPSCLVQARYHHDGEHHGVLVTIPTSARSVTTNF
jgi:hypothetical protein